MVVGELFVNLGIKGSDKTVGAIVGIQREMKNVASMSLEAKAAIVGAMYAVEQLFAKSGAQGTELSNFNKLLGVSTQTLQQYQYAARQVGVSNEDTEATFKNLQSAMAKIMTNKGAPGGWGQLINATGGINAQDIPEYARHPEKFIKERLQKYAQIEKNIPIRNEMLKTFGLSDSMIAALAKGAFNDQALAKAPTYSDKEVGSLDRANIAWSNLGNKIQMAIGHLNAAHGGEIVKDFGLLVDLGLKFADIILTTAERFHLFENFGAGLAVVAKGFSSLMDDLSSFSKNTASLDPVMNILKDLWELAKKLGEAFKDIGQSLGGMSEKFKLFENLAKIIDGIIKGATYLVDFLTKNASAFNVEADGGAGLIGLGKDALKSSGIEMPTGASILSTIGQALMEAVSTGGAAPGAGLRLVPPVGDAAKNWSPTAPGVPAPDLAPNITVNQELNFNHDSANVKANAVAMKKAATDAAKEIHGHSVNHALRSLPSQKIGN